MAITTVLIENHTPRVIILQPTASAPNGMRLIPGENNLPVKYVEELEALERLLFSYKEVVDSEGNVTMRKQYLGSKFPGRETLEMLQKPFEQPLGNGNVYKGPHITIHKRPEPAQEATPELPPKLPENLSAAQHIIASCDDETRLEHWLNEARGPIKTALQTRLKTLRG